jgi:cell division septation protein DedD
MQKKTLIVKKSPQAAPAPTQPTSPAKNPVITQQRYRPATPVKRPPAVQQPPKPPLPDPRPVVVMKPSQPAPTTQKPVVNKEPYRPAQSQPSPVVAKKPLGVATTPKPPLVEKEPPKPSMPTQGETVSAKGELFAEERIRSYPYSVYLGSYQTRERAEKAVFALQRKGLSPYWVEVHLGEKGVWYRVFNGYYKSQEEAEEFIKRKGLEDAKPKRTKYATLIGVYATESGAQQKFVSLSRLGYYPYLIDQANGESLLFIGAFLTKKGAERLHSELTSKGVRSRVVER